MPTDTIEGTAPAAVELLTFALRWIHVAAAMVWVGTTAALVVLEERRVAKTPPGSPALVAWMSWSSLYAWLAGLMLLFALYYHGPFFASGGARVPASTWGLALGAQFGLFLVYDSALRALGRSRKGRVLALCLALAVCVWLAHWLESSLGASARSVLVHVGASLGTVMIANVWQYVRPCQRRMVQAAARGETPDPIDCARSRWRARHNLVISLPAIALMLSVHLPEILGWLPAWRPVALTLGVGLAAGFGLLHWARAPRG